MVLDTDGLGGWVWVLGWGGTWAILASSTVYDIDSPVVGGVGGGGVGRKIAHGADRTTIAVGVVGR